MFFSVSSVASFCPLLEWYFGNFRLPNDVAAKTPEFQAAAWLMSEFVKKRTREYRAALELWLDWQVNKFVDRLPSALDNPKAV